MCFLGSEFLENGSRSFGFQWRVCFACKNEIQARHKEAQHTDTSHEPYSERLYNRKRMKGITEVRKLIWFQCMLLFWTIIGAECGHFELGFSKLFLKLFWMNRYQWALWGLICISNLRKVRKNVWTWEISMSTEYSEGLEISEGSYKCQNASKSMCFFGIWILWKWL